ncbi:MAG: ATP-dependent sacrificial sulfur transferase LarE [Bacteroidales bacterium]|nr:ATP-dependent sacrificial sulfur transferase LarE [Bacteroidales bacterium]
MLEGKLKELDSILTDLNSFVVAFSGGVDSSFLLYRAHSINKLNIMAVMIRTPYIPLREIREATEFVRTNKIKYSIIDIEFPQIIENNPPERCYLCKRALFEELVSFAGKNNYDHVVDGTNADDTKDFRPGLRALRELGIRSPLMESGLTKSDIRESLKKAGLAFWDKPAMACLLTRIPYGTNISSDMLRMVEQAEDLLFEKGYPGSRVRIHGDLARIECLTGYLEKLVHDPHKEDIISEMKKIGFRYISLDLEGYRTGSLNPVNRLP